MVPIESSYTASYIKTIAWQVLRIKFRIYKSAKNLYRGRRAVTRHSNRKLSIVMALSTTFTQCAPETTKFGKIKQNKGHFAVQGHSRSPILDSYSIRYARNRYILLPLLRLNHPPPTEGFLWDDLRKIFSECQWMANVPNGEEKLRKISTG